MSAWLRALQDISSAAPSPSTSGGGTASTRGSMFASVASSMANTAINSIGASIERKARQAKMPAASLTDVQTGLFAARLAEIAYAISREDLESQLRAVQPALSIVHFS